MNGARRPVAVVTGATAGIGLGLVRELSATHHVVVGGRNPSRVSQVVAELQSATGFVADLRSAGTESFDDAVGDLATQLPQVDVLVHSAGVLHRGAIADTSSSEWVESLTVNVVAAAAVTRALLPALRAARGLVLLVNSSSGLRSDASYGAYCASKFALTAMGDALREEERASGVRVTSLHPGRTDTTMQAASVAFDGDEYDPRYYLTVDSVVRAASAAINATPEASLDSILIRPALKHP